MIEFVFLDLDDTILDFHKAERLGIAKTFRQMGIEPTEAVLQRYHTINQECWKQLEKGLMTRQEVLVQRFFRLFEELGVNADAALCAKTYEKNLSEGHYFLPGAEEAVIRLSKQYRLFIASNGTASVQHGRLTSANLYRWFEKIFISQELGINKPDAKFFRLAFDQIPDFDPKKAIMVGDSLSSDIQGGINAGLTTCWVNPAHAPADPAIPADYEIENITQLEVLLQAL